MCPKAQSPDALNPEMISVVVPFFESQRTIRECVEALMTQDTADATVELLFVDNGAADGSHSIVDEVTRTSQSDTTDAITRPALRLLTESSPGAYAARNAAIRVARGEIIAFTDADCRPDRDWLQAIVRAMSRPEVGVVVGHCRYPPEASLALRLLERYENAKTRYVTNRCPAQYQFVYANNMAVRREVFERIGPFVEWARAGDTELVQRMARELPELRVVYSDAMRVTHLEFERARDRLRRLRTYTGTNSRIESFRELGWVQRLGVLARALVE